MELSFNINIINRVYFDCKAILCLIDPGRQGKYKKVIQGILNDTNEEGTSFLDCKHKHMMKSGAPPDKVEVLYRMLPIKLHGFTSRIDF